MVLHSRKNRIILFASGIAASLALLAQGWRAAACPFCSAAMQTLSQEIAGADGAVIAELVEPMPTVATGAQPGLGSIEAANATAKFRIVEILNGDAKIGNVKELDVVYFGEDPPGKKFLITGIAAVTPDKIDWTTPAPLSDRAVEYVRKLLSVPQTGVDRLAFFQDYLEDEDRLLAQDSYDEFARAPYSEVVALGPKMKRDRLLKWIDDPKVGPSGRRLFVTMLGVCGQPEDIGLLEGLLKYDYLLMKPGIVTAIGQSGVMGSALGLGLVDEMLHAEERRKKESLDAIIACYLKLKGPAGLELVNEKFLGNPGVEFKHLHSAIMALRFHGEETQVLPREKLLESMRLALDHKEFADQVIPDLTRWEDWEIMPRLVKMFKDAPADDWIRQAVVPYLLVAAEQPGEVGEKAKASLVELESLDPETVERARSNSAFSFLAQAAKPTTATASPTGSNVAAAVQNTAPAANIDPAQPNGSSRIAATNVSTPAAGESTKGGASGQKSETAAQTSNDATPAPAAALPLPSKLKIIGVPLLAAVVLLAIFAVLLRGTDPRSSQEIPNS